MFRSLFHMRASRPRLAGLMLAVGAALGFSMKAVFVKLAYRYGVDAVTLLMLRMLFALPFFIVIALLEERKASAPVGMRSMLLVLILGLIGYYLSSMLDFAGLQYITAGLERLILFVYPAFVVIFSALFLGKKIGKEEVMALLLCYAGIAIAMYHDVQFSGADTWRGVLLVLAATISYALFLIGSGEMIPKIGARRFTAYAMIVSCLAALIQFVLLRQLTDFQQPLPVYGYGFAMAVFSTVIPAFLLAAAIQRVGAGTASVVGALGPVMTIGLAVLLLGETATWMQMVGALLVIGGVSMLGVRKG
ncbi:EamA/RhaT family transporter [Mariprofundus erugo]|uniref:EamA/RhaT family transporter n=1 Tax=Mariprofundus erugo TaxID=2528639 RepID=A0A5R9H0B1_9PROT|nr:DMT family transporter [Mariprofundus erugo]TLS68494.1 EamA/RhaT family transporter [Mariprofundus erugo]